LYENCVAEKGVEAQEPPHIQQKSRQSSFPLLPEMRRVKLRSLIQYAEPGRTQMIAVAIKKSSREKTAGFQEMGTLRCDLCGEEFFIGHNPAWVDKRIAEKQAKWLEKVLAEEHERDKKHPDRIELPD
jgi:hypothetical protein